MVVAKTKVSTTSPIINKKKNEESTTTTTTPLKSTNKSNGKKTTPAPTTPIVTEQPKKVIEEVKQSVIVEDDKSIYSRPISSLNIQPVKDTEWYPMNIKSGGSFTNIPPILIDSDNLLLSNNNTIKIYNPNTGGLKSEVSLESNNDKITYIASSKSTLTSTMIIYLSSEKGRFYNYNIKNKTIEPINSIENQYKKGIVKFVISPTNYDLIYFLNNDGELCIYDKSKQNEPIKSINSSSSSNNNNNNILKNLQFISISSNGDYLTIASKSIIQVINLKNTSIVSSKIYKSEYQITSLSVIPSLKKDAVGDNIMISFGTTLGRLNFVNYNSENNQINFSSYNHWHSTPLISSYYSTDGSLLFTGGYENSLAIWTVSNMRRKVLPRLGGAIIHICCDPLTKLLAVTLSNNKVQIINISDYKPCSIITGLQGTNSLDQSSSSSSSQQSSSQQEQQKITSFIDPISNNLIFSGQKNGVVQFYNIKKDRVEKEITVSPQRNTDISTKKSKGQNLESKFNHNKLALEHSLVEPLAFHQVEPLFVSFESFSSSSPDKLESKVVLKDQILKFWETNSTNGDCKCVFSITTPHTSNILSMSFHPTKNILLTTSEKDFKLWKKQSMEAIDGITTVEKYYWTCYYEGSYRGLSCPASGFSKDGSIFAIACDHSVILWDSESMKLLDILSFSSRHVVHELSFISQHQLLVSYKENGAIVWDLSTKSPVKIYTFSIKPISVCDEYYALCPTSSRNRIMIFSVQSNELLFTDLVSIPKSQVVEQVLFSKDNEYHCIICITNDNLIYGYSTYSGRKQQQQPQIPQIHNTTESNSGLIKYSIEKSEYVKSKVEKRQQQLQQQKEIKSSTTTTTTTTTTTKPSKEEPIFIGKEIYTQLPSAKEIFGAASHIMPSVQNIYQKYMDSILVNSNSLTTNNNDNNNKTSKKQKIEIDNNNNNNNDNLENNNTTINIENDENNSNNNNNVKKQQSQQPQLENNKFSSMKNFFENLEPMETTTTVTTNATTASTASTTKEIKTKSSTSVVKKRKNTE